MKNVSRHFYLFFCLMIFILSCSDDDSPSPGTDIDKTDGKSMFIVEYEQTGDLEVFERALGLGKGFVYFDTQEPAPTDLLREDLANNKYKFITEDPIRKLDMSLYLFWLSYPNSNFAEIDITIKVFRDEELIDSINVYTNSDSLKNNNLQYHGDWEYEGI